MHDNTTCTTPHHGLVFRMQTGRVSQARTRTHVYVVSAPFRTDLSDGWQVIVKRYGRVVVHVDGLPDSSAAMTLAEHHAGEVKAGIIPLEAKPSDHQEAAELAHRERMAATLDRAHAARYAAWRATDGPAATAVSRDLAYAAGARDMHRHLSGAPLDEASTANLGRLIADGAE